MTSILDAADAPTTRGHKKRSRTRQTLLDAALRVLAESGEGFSLTEVAARAGVSHGTFYNYFRDREELMDALVPYSVEEFAVRTGINIVMYALTGNYKADQVHVPDLLDRLGQ